MTTTSDQTRHHTEFKHITKQKKRDEGKAAIYFKILVNVRGRHGHNALSRYEMIMRIEDFGHLVRKVKMI